MSEEHKHKPLNSEELLDLLNKKNNKEFNDLDDFEKEAFEGFSVHTDPKKVSELMHEINQSLSNRISKTKEKGSQKNRIIWFSAAASLVVIFLLTIFLVKESKQDSDANIALNEPKNEQLIAPGMKPVENGVVNEGNNMIEPALSEISHKQLNLAEEKSLEQKDVLLKVASAENSPVFQPDQNAVLETKSGESKNSNDEDVAVTGGVALADKLEVSKKEQAGREESEVDNGYRVAQTSSTIANDEQKVSSKKADMDSEKAKQSNKSKSNSNDVVTMSAVGTSKTSPAPASRANEETAYYSGGESAIKESVVTYLKTDKNTLELIGKYKIKATVSSEGNLKVKSVFQISNEFCNCTDKIEKALNEMTNWHPAIINGKKTSSDVEFEISF